MLLAVRNFILGNLAGGVALALIEATRSGSLASELVAQLAAVMFESGLFFLALAVYRILLRRRGQFSLQGLAWGLGGLVKVFDWAWTTTGQVSYVNYVVGPLLAAVVFIVVARKVRATAVGQ